MATHRSHAASDQLGLIVYALRASDASSRSKALRRLREYVLQRNSEMSGEAFGKFMDDLIKRIHELINSSDASAKTGGIQAIDQLIDIDLEENATTITRFANYLRVVLPHQDFDVMQAAAQALGHLARAGGTLTADFVDFEVKRALEWLQIDRVEARRLASVLILGQLASNAPTLFYVHVGAFFDLIWTALRDSKQVIREQAVVALRACLSLIAKRESSLRSTWYAKILNEAQLGWKGNADCIHGSLLAMGELLRNTNKFMMKHFRETCDNVLRFREHRDRNVRRAVIQLIPLLARFAPGLFTPSYLSTSMTYLLHSLGHSHLRPSAYTSIGHLALAVNDSILPHIDRIIPIVREGLNPRGKFKFCPEALTTVSNFAEAVGSPLEKHLSTLIEPMFAGGLTGELTDTLSVVALHVPGLLPVIQKRLLLVLSTVLSSVVRPKASLGSGGAASAYVSGSGINLSIGSVSFKVGGSNGSAAKSLGTGATTAGFASAAASAATTAAATSSPGSASLSGVSVDLVVRALTTLGQFDFSGCDLTEFVQVIVLDFLENDDPEVRRAAALTASKAVVPTGEHAPTRGPAAIVVSEVLDRLLVVAIADPDASLRRAVLESFWMDRRFDHHLAQADSLRALFIALNDEVFEIRELAIAVIGRLTARNPAYVMPSLRKTLIQLLTELEYSTDNRSKEEAARLLGHLIAASQKLVQPYVDPILRSLLPKVISVDAIAASSGAMILNASGVGGQATTTAGSGVGTAAGTATATATATAAATTSVPVVGGNNALVASGSSGVVTRVLAALGELGRVGGAQLVPHVASLVPVLMELLQDQSSVTRREVALRTLGLLISATGWVIEPYLRFPDLLPILAGLLRSETVWSVRCELIRDLGVIGALDPYRYKAKELRLHQRINLGAETPMPPEMLPHLSRHSEDYYPTVVINELMSILRDPSLSLHHHSVVQALMLIFKLMGLKSVPFLPQVMPPLLLVMRTCESGFRDFLFRQLGELVLIVRQHIRPYLPDIFGLIDEFWGGRELLVNVVRLIESTSTALRDDFKVYVPRIIPPLLQALANDSSDMRSASVAILQALERFGSNIEDFMHLVAPAIVRLVEQERAPLVLRVQAVQTLGSLADGLDVSDYASRIIHSLSRVLVLQAPTMRAACMETLTTLVYQLGQDYAVFVLMINKVIVQNRLQGMYPVYEEAVSRLLKGQPLQRAGRDRRAIAEARLRQGAPDSAAGGGGDAFAAADSKLSVNHASLKKAWEASQRSTKDDWLEWMRKLSVELLRASPSRHLRACSPLAQVYHPLARALFNAGFVSCWHELSSQYQDSLVHSLETALSSPQIPTEILQVLLNLAEFMEHDDKPLPIDTTKLGTLAEACHSYAKALHYKEIEFHSNPSSTIEALISINNLLQQPEAAVGILLYAQKAYQVRLRESWYEKLHRWEDALAAYEQACREDPTGQDPVLGKMRCLHALGEWEQLGQLATRTWRLADTDVRRIIAPDAATAAWNLGQWSLMGEYVRAIELTSTRGKFFRAVLSLHRGDYPQARRFIDETRQALDVALTAGMSESYNRAYDSVVVTQQLAEMEEVIEYRTSDVPQRQAQIRALWMQRLKGCQRSVEVWQKLLAVRSIVMSPQDDVEMWLKFASLCRKNGRLQLALKTITSLIPGLRAEDASDTAHSPTLRRKSKGMSGRRRSGLVVADDVLSVKGAQAILSSVPINVAAVERVMADVDPHIQFQYIKWLWASKQQGTALERLRVFSRERLSPQDPLQARCHLNLGRWAYELAGDRLSDADIPGIIASLATATDLDPGSHLAWHAWAFMNFKAMQHYERLSERQGAASRSPMMLQYAVPAVRGFFRSITLGQGGSLQDTLRVLTIWFRHGSDSDVESSMLEGFNMVSIDTWLQVIPQIIARIHIAAPSIRRLILDLLTRVGRSHPQALVYPLTVATKSHSEARRSSAEAVLADLRQHNGPLVDASLLVSEELIRVAILWHEMWYEGLEEASRLWFGDKNADGMFATLAPLHELLERGAETMREVSFQQAYGRDLAEAWEWCRKYQQDGRKIQDLNAAWDLYYHVFRRINKQRPHMTQLELNYVSPKLLAARGLALAVPGTYAPGEDVVRIESFVTTLTVIASKQRPRKLSINGSDGKRYTFLLKGHEDPRQDERVMQLFGLVNTLLAADPESSKRQLSITRYSVVPLSPNSGLLGWVPHSDTLHQLIKEYRDSRKIQLNIEHRLMIQMAPDYDNLPLMNKIEVFEYAVENTAGQDLYKVLWLKSRNSETWLERRTNYTRSLAVMSMVGYILGLGDRHPSNLMLHQLTGKICHIDFGDCFEVAMHREKVPEKVPFRLTRMLISAMEVSGIEGNFRFTCESIMDVLRANKDSLLAVLDAFVHDPLINWRLLTTIGEVSTHAASAAPSRAPVSSSFAGASPARSLTRSSRVAADALSESLALAGSMAALLGATPDQVVDPSMLPSPGRASISHTMARSVITAAEAGEAIAEPQVLNKRAVKVMKRVADKLTGRDFDHNEQLGVKDQVEKLIQEATSNENLCGAYIGWCSWW